MNYEFLLKDKNTSKISRFRRRRQRRRWRRRRRIWTIFNYIVSFLSCLSMFKDDSHKSYKVSIFRFFLCPSLRSLFVIIYISAKSMFSHWSLKASEREKNRFAFNRIVCCRWLWLRLTWNRSSLFTDAYATLWKIEMKDEKLRNKYVKKLIGSSGKEISLLETKFQALPQDISVESLQNEQVS